ncbi:MAG: 30S ribosome-binding factor RbfA [Pseudomonadota bacterium]
MQATLKASNPIKTMSKRFRSDKGPSQRQLRAGELLRHALVEILQREDLRDPALSGVSITVSEVRPSPDLRRATVYCAALGQSLGDTGNNGASDSVIEALNRVAPKLRHHLGTKIDLKFTPELIFKSDESFAEARRIDELLAHPDVKRDL